MASTSCHSSQSSFSRYSNIETNKGSFITKPVSPVKRIMHRTDLEPNFIGRFSTLRWALEYLIRSVEYVWSLGEILKKPEAHPRSTSMFTETFSLLNNLFAFSIYFPCIQKMFARRTWCLLPEKTSADCWRSSSGDVDGLIALRAICSLKGFEILTENEFQWMRQRNRFEIFHWKERKSRIFSQQSWAANWFSPEIKKTFLDTLIAWL